MNRRKQAARKAVVHLSHWIGISDAGRNISKGKFLDSEKRARIEREDWDGKFKREAFLQYFLKMIEIRES
jgi:hypothetical protein